MSCLFPVTDIVNHPIPKQQKNRASTNKRIVQTGIQWERNLAHYPRDSLFRCAVHPTKACSLQMGHWRKENDVLIMR